MELLERDRSLELLSQHLRRAAAGSGSVALVYGEAGIGKTALLQQFLVNHRDTAAAMLGGCDALLTPEPLAALYDIALQTGGRLLDLLNAKESRLSIFAELLHGIQLSARPVIIAVEDIHWADDATLDALRYVGRRIAKLRALLLLTYRDDELDGRHQLWTMLGDLPAASTLRIPLAPLSREAVARLAAHSSRSPDRLIELSGGNPFQVTELLAAAADEEIPKSVREATLARASRLSPAARSLLDFCAINPNRTENWLLGRETPPDLIDQCLACGLLMQGEDSLAFRHELARLAIEDAIPLGSRRELHQTALDRLLARDGGSVALARLVHHAVRAGNDEMIRRHAPEAARQAAAVGAHREAAAHLRTALDHAAGLDEETRARLLEELAYECFLINALDEAKEARRAALAIHRQQANGLKVGDNLRWLSRLAWFQAQGAEARALAHDAIAALEPHAPGRELAMAYSNLSQLHMLAENCPDAVRLGELALDLARRLGLPEIQSHALNNIGQAQFLAGNSAGTAKLRESLAIAKAHDLHEQAARAHTNLIFQSLVVRDYAHAAAEIATGIDFAREHDQEGGALYMRALQARLFLEQGQWQKAQEEAGAVLQAGQTIARLVAIVVLALVRLRSGDKTAGALLEEAAGLAASAGDISRVAPTVAARAEAAWLAGTLADMRPVLEKTYAAAREHPEPWRLGELSLWCWRAGLPIDRATPFAEPYRLEVEGDWQKAADAWQAIGCPYERALALAGGDEDAKLRSLELLDVLGARPAASLVRDLLRAQGMRNVPRGPRAATKANPHGLTDRQVDILVALTANLSNKEIAARLRISPKTVDHHVTALLGKLEVASRRAAASHPVALALAARPRASATPT